MKPGMDEKGFKKPLNSEKPGIETPYTTENEKKPLSEFAQETTFHGVKYIFNDKISNPFRRALWFLMWTSCIGIFVYQVSVRIAEYRNFPTSINAQVIYNTTMDFPSVTICNQNQYRIRKAAKLKMFELLDEAYGSDDFNETSHESFDNLTNMNMSNIFQALSHQKADLIAQCQFNYQGCDVDTSFESIITDMGFCYTFNSFKTGSMQRIVTDSGMSAGLRLIFNVEQYEYMKGPHVDAGLKVHLHDWHEFPLVTDTGFIAMPGSHTIASISLHQVKSLPAPYGTCNESNASFNECRRRCLTLQAVRRCGCRDLYMPETVDDEIQPLCSTREKLGCLKRLSTQVRDANDQNCACSQPCRRRWYDVSVSTGQLSRLNIEQIVLQNKTEKAQVMKNFLEAREMSQRHVNASREKNALILGGAKMSYDQMMKSFLYATEVMSNSSSFSADLKTVDMYDFTNAFKQFTSNISHSGNVMLQLIEQYGFMSRCVMDKSEEFEKEADELNKQNVQNCLQKIANQETCSDALEVDVTLVKIHNKVQEYFKYLNTLINEVYPGFEDLYKDSGIKIPVDLDKCKKNILQANASVEQFLNAITDAYAMYIANASNADIALFLLTKVDTMNTGSHNGPHQGTNPCESSSKWMKVEIEKSMTPSPAKHSAPLESLQSIHKDVLKTINKANVHINTSVSRTVGLLDDFINRAITKYDLIAPFSERDFIKALDSLENYGSTLSMKSGDIEAEMKEALEELIEFFNDFTTSSIPIIKLTDLISLDIVTKLQNNPFSMKINLQTTRSVSAALDDFAKTSIESFYKAVLRKTDTLTKDISDFGKKAVDIQDDLSNYKADTIMNEDFFMNNFLMLDVFYHEMNYEQITQQMSFSFLSLLSEIGGFLGLLLGASVLTMCEIIDYIASGCSHGIKRKPNVVQVYG